MDGQMPEGPPDFPDDFFGDADYTGVLHDNDLDVSSAFRVRRVSFVALSIAMLTAPSRSFARRYLV